MADSGERQPQECPRLQPGRPFGSSGRIIGLYCRRDDGGVRVPRRDEIRAFCLTSRWPECPGSRTHAPAP
jgi:hypothetical protein